MDFEYMAITDTVPLSISLSPSIVIYTVHNPSFIIPYPKLYPLVNEHHYGESQCFLGKLTINGNVQ